MQYIEYRRKSSEQDERQALSNESQRLELERKFPDLHPTTIDLEESKSAFIPDNRPKFAEMIELIKSGQADGIIAWHPDRLSRNEIDAATITYLVRTGVIKDLKFGSYYFDNSPEGIMMLQSALSHSQYSSSKLSVDVKRGLRTKAGMGQLPTGAKPGYMNDKYAEKGNKTVQSDPTRFPLIKKAWELMLTGAYTPPQILDKLNNEWGYRTPKHKRIGGNPMAKSRIYEVFRDTFYYGSYEFPKGSGVWYDGKHEKMITKEEFERVQMLLGRKGRPRAKTHEFAYTGLMNCGECNAVITAEEKWQIICPSCKLKFVANGKTDCPKCKILIEAMVNPKILHYIYYHCTKRKNPNCTQRSVEVSKLEEQLSDKLKRIQISQAFQDWAIEELNKETDVEVNTRNSVSASLKEAHKDVLTELDNLLKLKISPKNVAGELISDSEYLERKTSLLKDKKSLEQKLKETNQSVENWMTKAEKDFDFARNAPYWLENGSLEKKRIILAGLGSNPILKDKLISLEVKKPYRLIEEAIKKSPDIGEMFEPEKEAATTNENGVSVTPNPIWLLG